MKVSGQKLHQKLQELMVEKKFFMKKIILKLALILKMIYPCGSHQNFLIFKQIKNYIHEFIK